MGIIPRENKFFFFLEKISQNVVEGAKALCDFIKNFDGGVDKAKKVLEREHEGDILTHEIIDLLNRSFITPIDREDIHGLVTSLDDIIDLIEEVADRIVMYKVAMPEVNALKLAEIVLAASEEVNKAIQGMKNLKRSRRILDHCIEVNRLENEGDRLSREALATLLNEGDDPVYVIKLKEIFECLESAIDKCEDVANIIESVVVKYA